MESRFSSSTRVEPLILIADDNCVNMLVLRLMLKKAGYVALEAADGLQAVEIALRERPDLIFMDIMMPKMNGISAARQILSAGGPLPRIVAITGNSTDDVQQECAEFGFDEVLLKPIDKNTLLATIHRLFPLSEAR